MYNRYIPQSDGSYRRSSVREQRRETPQQQPCSNPEPPCVSPPEPAVCPIPPVPPNCPSPEHRSCPVKAGNYLRNLLPADLDTEDLLVIVLLLLMTGEGREGGNLPLLTLALYLFL